ncbi:hypothetical protein DASC09_014380 [Saccharomycopsis crataegensis]|uniref:Uncharacterized protein n=1 Tax=Saccharomycopsis crataegensis TaxID=43959 RepID=A0AAV5QGY7_9ASCO|nr:hypothetical protein DASC09_014380 [Saccharomycopsis crataegensis]
MAAVLESSVSFQSPGDSAKDCEIEKLKSTLKNVTEKYNHHVYNNIENSTLIKKLNESLKQEKLEVTKLQEENDRFKQTITSLQSLANELANGVKILKEKKLSQEKLELQHSADNALLKSEHNKQIELLKKKHAQEIEGLKRSNKVLKDLVQQQQHTNSQPNKSTINTIQEESKTTAITNAPKELSNMKSAKQNKFKHHRKSRSFGIGETMNFNFQFKQQGRTHSPISSNFFKNNNVTSTQSNKISPLTISTFKKPNNISPCSDNSSDNDSDYSSLSLNSSNSAKSDATSMSEASGANFKGGNDTSGPSNLSKPSANFFREFQKPLSPLKAKFGKQTNSQGNLKINSTEPLNISRPQMESPISESKMNRFFGTSNISLVNMSRPIRSKGAKGVMKKSKKTDSDLFEMVTKPQVKPKQIIIENNETEVPESMSINQPITTPDSELYESDKNDDISIEDLESFTAEICDATTVGYSSLDPTYVISNSKTKYGGSIDDLNSTKSFGSGNNEFESPRLINKPSFGGESSSNSSSNFSSPRKQIAHNFSNNGSYNFQQSSYTIQRKNSNFSASPPNYNNQDDIFGLYPTRSRNGSCDNFTESLKLTVSNTSNFESNINNKNKAFMGFEKPVATGLFGRRKRSNSNSSSSNLRSFF